MERKMNLAYAALQGLYWMLYCAVVSFAGVYLLAAGFSNTQVGLVLAAGSAAALVTQPLAAAAADSGRRIGPVGLIALLLAVLGVLLALLAWAPPAGRWLGAAYALALCLVVLLQPLVNAFAFFLELTGVRIRFGTARGTGSLTFAAVCALLGALSARLGVAVFPTAGLLLAGTAIALMLFFGAQRRGRRHGAADSRTAGTNALSKAGTGTLQKGNTADAEAVGANALSKADADALSKADADALSKADADALSKAGTADTVLLPDAAGAKPAGAQKAAARGWRACGWLLAGTALLFYGHAFVNSFLIQITRAAGGDVGVMGTLMTVAALTEMPAMLLFDRLYRRISCAQMLRFSSCVFVLRGALMAAAGTVPALYAANLLQAGAFALFIPASIRYVSDALPAADNNKGQAILSAMITAGNILSSFAGGRLIDTVGLPAALWLGVAVSACGAAAVWAGMRPRRA